ncbi:hypothetical protein BPLS_P2204 [Bathymodiolus platifrons methanotrophic gill symbiont]|nr:hypothetical protein BPLS_P2204 [Bathymodiolus platifrons methanotrophic gill symbiont]
MMSPIDLAAEFNESFKCCVNDPLFIDRFYELFLSSSGEVKLMFKDTEQARHATSQHSGTPVTNIHSPTQRMGDALVALRPSQLRTKPCSVKTTSNGWTAIRNAILASLARY